MQPLSRARLSIGSSWRLPFRDTNNSPSQEEVPISFHHHGASTIPSTDPCASTPLDSGSALFFHEDRSAGRSYHLGSQDARTPDSPDDESDVGSGGEASSCARDPAHGAAAGPLHHRAAAAAAAASSSSLLSLSSSASLSRRPASSPNNNINGGGPLRLTLSAFRRPERTIRLTASDPNRVLAAEYNLFGNGCRVLGHGAFSTVRSALRKRDGERVAIKTIAKHEALRSRRLRVRGRHYMEEWEVLRKFERHPHVINLLDVFETDEEVHLVLEYCPGGELFAAVRRGQRRGSDTGTTAAAAAFTRGVTERQAARIAAQVLSALADLHDAGIVHRDIKLENILIAGTSGLDGDDVRVKICDFGMARSILTHPDDGSQSNSDGEDSPTTPGIGRSFSIVGSNYYIAPEVVEGEAYSTLIDMYSLGVSLYLLLIGYPPVFSGEEVPKVLFPGNISEPAKRLVERLLSADADGRVTARDALQDPWIRMHSARPSFSAPATPAASGALDRPSSSSLEAVHRTLQLADRKRRPGPGVSLADLRPVEHARRRRRSSSCVLALADLCCDVTAPTAFAPSSAAEALSGAASSSSTTTATDPLLATPLPVL